MAHKSEFCIDDKQTASEKFYSYPAHKIVGILEDSEKTEAAIKALRLPAIDVKDLKLNYFVRTPCRAFLRAAN